MIELMWVGDELWYRTKWITVRWWGQKEGWNPWVLVPRHSMFVDEVN